MSRFFSIPGMAPSQTEGKRDRYATPDELRADPRYREYFAARRDTSHRFSGLDVEHDPTKGNILYKGDPARVLHEEFNQHTGQLETYVARSTRLGSGTTKLTWTPEDARRIVVTDTKAVHE